MKKTAPKTTAEKIANALEFKKQADNELKELRKQKKAEELAAMKQRHTERGAIAEKLFDEKAELSNEDFQKKLEDILHSHKRNVKSMKSHILPADESDVGIGENETQA